MKDQRQNPANVTETIQDPNSGLKFRLHQWVDDDGFYRSYLEPAFYLVIKDGIVAAMPNDPKLSHGHEPDSRKDGGVQ
jgi:hypothetical protein